MPSKCVDFYSFVSEGYEIEIKKADAGKKDNPDVVKTIVGHSPLQISKESHDIDSALTSFMYEGKFQFIARKNGQELFERSIRVNSITGNIDIEDIANLKIPSRVEQNYSLSFGLYDSDSGTASLIPDAIKTLSKFSLDTKKWIDDVQNEIKSGKLKVSQLTNRHQFYATLTPNMKQWQKEIFDEYKAKHGKLDDLPFSKLFLPGSHDAGMYTYLPGPISDFANTQRDTTLKQLELGSRYFDFRPGKIRPDYKKAFEEIIQKRDSFTDYYKNVLDYYKNLFMTFSATVMQPFVGEIRHIHAFIPGDTFQNFISEIISFLEANQSEIVVVQLANDGFMSSTMIETPNKSQLLSEIQDLLNNTTIKIGDKANLKESVQKILDADKRLIILFREDDAQLVDTYTDDYASYDSQIVIDNFNRINFSDEKDKDYFKFQHQLTANGVFGAMLRVVTSIPGRFSLNPLEPVNIFLSPLWSTKPGCDQRSYEWLLKNLNYTSRQVLMVGINDFYDNAFTQVAKTISKMRLELFDLYPRTTDTLQQDERLNKGDSLVSPNGHYKLIYQHDGNLVVYNLSGKAIWASNTNGKGGDYAQMQKDGNLVIYKGNREPVWSIHAQVENYTFSKDAILKMQDDGNLVIYKADLSSSIWAR